LEGPGLGTSMRYTFTFEDESIHVNIRNTYTGMIFSLDGTSQP